MRPWHFWKLVALTCFSALDVFRRQRVYGENQSVLVVTGSVPRQVPCVTQRGEALLFHAVAPLRLFRSNVSGHQVKVVKYLRQSVFVVADNTLERNRFWLLLNPAGLLTSLPFFKHTLVHPRTPFALGLYITSSMWLRNSCERVHWKLMFLRKRGTNQIEGHFGSIGDPL